MEGAEDHGGDEGQLSRLRLLTWTVDPHRTSPTEGLQEHIQDPQTGRPNFDFEMSLSSSLYPPDPLRDVPGQPSQNRRDGGTCLPHQCLKEQQMQKRWGDLSLAREELRLGDR